MAEIELPPKSALELQIEQEKAELDAVPKIPVQQFMGGPMVRCHMCGAVCHPELLKPFETVQTQHGPLERLACPNCHPNRNG